MARPTSCTPLLTETLARAMRTGISIRGACALVKIHPDTYYGWLQRGENGEEPYATFSDVIKEARAKGERYLVTKLRRGDAKAVAGPIFLLKASYGYRDSEPVQIVNNAPPPPPSDAEREADARAWAAARGLRIVPADEERDAYDPATATKARS